MVDDDDSHGVDSVVGLSRGWSRDSEIGVSTEHQVLTRSGRRLQVLGQLNVDETLRQLDDPPAAEARREIMRQEMLEMTADELLDYMAT